MAKQVIFNEEAKKKIKVGIDIVENAIRTTIGPNGRNAFIDNEMQPKITNDGKTIANSIVLEDKLENMGAWLVKNASSQTDDDAGDGTSTTSVLLKAIIDEAQKRPESPMVIKRSLTQWGKEVTRMIQESATPIEDNQIASVATISAEDEKIGVLIDEIIQKVGRRVPINVSDNVLPEIEYEISDGLETNVGFAHHAFINNQRNGTAEMENVAVFATDRRIGSLPDLMVLLQTLEQNKITSLVILASDIDNGVMGSLIQSKMVGAFNSLVINARNAELEDMVAMSGATLISELSGIKFTDIKLEHLGRVKKIVSSAKKTTIINDNINAKTQETMLRSMAEATSNVYEKKFLNDRADRLAGGIAVIKVGAHVDTEREYQKFKIEDAINATKSALEEGIVDGGGMCLYRISNRLKGNSIGECILRNALKEPLKAIIENCNEDYTRIIKRLPNKKGYDAKNNKFVNMRKAGIIDPARVTRCAFENSLQSASNYITCQVAITEKNEVKK